MITIDDLKTKAGLLLYRQLPEEYRFLDLDTAAPARSATSRPIFTASAICST